MLTLCGRQVKLVRSTDIRHRAIIDESKHRSQRKTEKRKTIQNYHNIIFVSCIEKKMMNFYSVFAWSLHFSVFVPLPGHLSFSC